MLDIIFENKHFKLFFVWLLLSTALPSFSNVSNDSVRIEQMLNSARLLRDDANCVLFFAEKFIDIPYVAHTLDLDKEEHLVVNTRALDCTTFVENVVALTLCHKKGLYKYADFKQMLRLIRYRNGDISYCSRLHYFTDWIEDNERMGFVQKVEFSGYPFSAVQKLKIDYMSTHYESYAMLKLHPEWLKQIRKMEDNLTGKTYRYIPKKVVADYTSLRNIIHDGDIIAILTNKKGLDTSHIGFALWKKDGLHLFNASQIHKKVVVEPMLFHTYMQKHPSQIGIRVCRVV